MLLAAGAVIVAGGFALAQQPSLTDATARRAALYQPFTAPPGERTTAEVAWPAPASVVLTAPIPGIGRTATAAEIAGWDIAVGGDGQRLPPGRGSVRDGEELYLTNCASCHGDFGEGIDRWPALIGGRGTLNTDQARRTVGSYWQHAPAVFDYVRRAMPYTQPQSLTNDEYYAITAYILNLNELLPEDAVLDAESLRAIRMPNRDGFVLEARPDTPDAACTSNCRAGRAVRIEVDSRQFIQPGSHSGFSEPQ
jgi:mono/diheme cytochrome c family protein